MESKYIALIVIVAIFLFFVALFCFLALKYQQKHQPYREARDKYIQEYKDLKKKNEIFLTKIKTDVKLPEGENFYLIKNNLNYYEQVVKPTKKNSKVSKAIIDEYEQDYEFIEQKANYSLSNKVAKYYRQNLTADFLITNKRILVKNNNQVQEINFNQVLKVRPTIITVKKTFFLGIIIYTNDKLYRIIDNDLNDLLVIQALLENKEEL